MLEDRSYMRSSPFESQRSLTITLLMVNTAIFVLQEILRFYAPAAHNWYWNTFALSPGGLAKGYIWQLLTFQFMHAGLLHLIINLLVIYFFGSAIEEALGRKGVLKVYFASGFVGGILQTLFMAVLPKYFGYSVVGASAGGFGLVAAFATLFPERQITLLLFFVIPFSMRAKTLLWVFTAMALFGIVVPDTGVAHAAHLGGIAAGCAYIAWFVRGRGWLITLPSFRVVRPQRELIRTASASKGPFWQKQKPAAPPDDLPPAEFISREVDPILDKISAHGIQSLTERERRILEAARAKMTKR